MRLFWFHLSEWRIGTIFLTLDDFQPFLIFVVLISSIVSRASQAKPIKSNFKCQISFQKAFFSFKMIKANMTIPTKSINVSCQHTEQIRYNCVSHFCLQAMCLFLHFLHTFWKFSFNYSKCVRTFNKRTPTCPTHFLFRINRTFGKVYSTLTACAVSSHVS